MMFEHTCLSRMPTKKIHVKYIILDEGEFLYEEISNNLYTCKPPHILVGKIDLKDFSIVKK